jgi:phosphoglycerol geranylgeranyltransferase
MSVKDRLFSGLDKKSKYVVLLDPEKLDEKSSANAARVCSQTGVDALFVGGSTADRDQFRQIVKTIKKHADIPVIIFPGSAGQIVPEADAILYMSLISGRNPQFLVEEQVKGVSAIQEYGLETISMGYILIESDKPSAVEKISQTKPILRNDINGALHHALAAQYMGMSTVYLEGGSGVGLSVPNEMVEQVKGGIDIPLIVGGGIKIPEEAAQKVKAGADIVVTGTVLEQGDMSGNLKAFVDAVHSK